MDTHATCMDACRYGKYVKCKLDTIMRLSRDNQVVCSIDEAKWCIKIYYRTDNIKLYFFVCGELLFRLCAAANEGQDFQENEVKNMYCTYHFCMQ